MRISDRSSDVCSSDLAAPSDRGRNRAAGRDRGGNRQAGKRGGRGRESGRASLRERVSQYGWIAVVAAVFKKQNQRLTSMYATLQRQCASSRHRCVSSEILSMLTKFTNFIYLQE